MAATATGMKLRGFHSNRSSSTASNTAATGVAKIADMPPAAPGDQQGFAFRRGQMKQLREQRTERAAGHDDGPFRAERAAGADGDGGGNWLEHRNFRLHAAAPDQNRLQRLGDAVAANFRRTIARHETDDQRANHRRR